MSIARHIWYLREELGLSYRQIARIVYGRTDSLTILKVNGIYKTYMRRYNASKINVITKHGVITGDNIADTVNYYSLDKVLEDHSISFIGNLAEERKRLARLLKHVKDPGKRREVYRRINRVKLLELVFIVYDIIGLSQYDPARMYLSALYSVAKKLVDRVDLDRDGVKRISNSIRYLNGEASAFLYIVYFTVLHNTPYNHLLDKINEIIYSLTSEKHRSRKIEKIKKIITEKYSDILASIIIH